MSKKILNGDRNPIKIGKLYIDGETGEYIRVTKVVNKDTVEIEIFSGELNDDGTLEFYNRTADDEPITIDLFYIEELCQEDLDFIKARLRASREEFNIMSALAALAGIPKNERT